MQRLDTNLAERNMLLEFNVKVLVSLVVLRGFTQIFGFMFPDTEKRIWDLKANNSTFRPRTFI